MKSFSSQIGPSNAESPFRSPQRRLLSSLFLGTESRMHWLRAIPKLGGRYSRSHFGSLSAWLGSRVTTQYPHCSGTADVELLPMVRSSSQPVLQFRSFDGARATVSCTHSLARSLALFLSLYLPTYPPTYLPTYLPTCLPNCRSIYLPIDLLICLSFFLSLSHSPSHSPPLSLSLCATCLSVYSSAPGFSVEPWC